MSEPHDIEGLVEKIAKLIDPIAFDQHRRWKKPSFHVSSAIIAEVAADVERARSKARAIVAIPQLAALLSPGDA